MQLGRTWDLYWDWEWSPLQSSCGVINIQRVAGTVITTDILLGFDDDDANDGDKEDNEDEDGDDDSYCM